MIRQIQSYIQQHNLFNSGTPILVACSGGVDSMVLISLLRLLNHTIAIAHCNFQLRADESEGDEQFVKDFAQKHKLPFYSTRFDTKHFKDQEDVSTQMAARQLRYEWLEEIRKQNGFHVIATAHHLDDQLETVLMHITKGTGIHGLSGMKPKNGFVVRPLLEISKEGIAAYAKEHSIAYREDSSNATEDYQRNHIRHQVMPALKKINPSLQKTSAAFISRMRDYEVLTAEYIHAIKKKCWSEKKGMVEIKMGFIKTHPAGKTILFHLLEEFGFNSDQVLQVYENFADKNSLSGKQYFSDAHRLVADRTSLFMLPKETERDNYLLFDKLPNKIIFNNYKLVCSEVPSSEVNLKGSTRFAYFDLDKITLPLLIRYPEEGDYFYPFGLSKPKTPGKPGKKKLSKYYKDEKFPLHEKENTPILFSGEKALWLVGHRIDDRFKVTDKTRTVFKIVIVDNEVECTR